MTASTETRDVTQLEGRRLDATTFAPFASRAMFWRPNYLAASAWIEHVPFAFWLIEAHRPKTLVELGSHWGVSYFAFCQAIARLELDARSYAVDTWKGDDHAGFYGEEVYSQVKAHNEALYSGFSRLVRSRFDEALSHFSDGTIDLLHIDGLHTLDAVAHDFEAWRPKLSMRAVVVFHDTNVRERGFGVHKLFERLRAEHPCFEFVHGHGLGVLGIGTSQSEQLVRLFEADGEPLTQQGLREVFGRLGHACADAQQRMVVEGRATSLTRDLATARKQIDEARAALDKTRSELAERNKELQDERLRGKAALDLAVIESRRAQDRIAILETELARNRNETEALRTAHATVQSKCEVALHERDAALAVAKAAEIDRLAVVAELEAAETALNAAALERDAAVLEARASAAAKSAADEALGQMSCRVADLTTEIAALNAEIEGRSSEVQTLEARIDERFRELAEVNKMLVERERDVSERNARIADMNANVEERSRELAELTKLLVERERDVSERDGRIADMNANVEERFHELAELTKLLVERERDVSERDGRIADMTSIATTLEATIGLKNEELHHLRVEVAELRAAAATASAALDAITRSRDEAREISSRAVAERDRAIAERERAASVAEEAAAAMKLRVNAITREAATLKANVEERFRELAELTKMLIERDNELERLSLQAAGYRDRLDEITSSRWWRIISPLRSLGDLVGGERRRVRRMIERSGRFDAKWYLEKYPDVKEAMIDPLDHYLQFGANEGRDPSASFSSRGYLAAYEDVAKSCMNPLEHYVLYGRIEGRRAEA